MPTGVYRAPAKIFAKQKDLWEEEEQASKPCPDAGGAGEICLAPTSRSATQYCDGYKASGHRGRFMVKEIRPFLSSTSFTQTVTTSPTETTSEGCLTKRSEISEMCTRPS